MRAHKEYKIYGRGRIAVQLKIPHGRDRRVLRPSNGPSGAGTRNDLIIDPVLSSRL
jgi:hypothetical protein